MIKFPTWPVIASEEIAAVSAVLESGKINYWTGESGKKFEAEFAKYIGVKHAVAVANGTLGLELALKAMQLPVGAEVIVPSKTFIATASAVVACQGVPIIADIDLDTQNISLATIKPLVTTKTKGIILVHLGGLMCDMDPILEFAKQNNLFVIEDCAQAHGARYKNKLAGSLGDVSVFSFCQDKIMTTGGEGGMVVTNDPDIWQRAWEYKDHGKDYVESNSPGGTAFKWLHNSFGSNYRLSEMQAAIGLQQLYKLPDWLEIRKRNAEYLLNNLEKIPGLEVFRPNQDYSHAYYKFYFTVQLDKLKPTWSRDKILAALGEQGIPCREGSCSEIYREQAFVKNNLGPKDRLPNAQILSATSMMLPVHPTLEIEHMQIMLEAIRQIMATAVK